MTISASVWEAMPQVQKDRLAAEGWRLIPPPALRPGDGWPGRIEPYVMSLELLKGAAKYDLTPHWFVPAPVDKAVFPQYARYPNPDRLPYLLYTPKKGTKPVPLVLYFAGTGEVGTNLMAHFKQTALSDKLASPAFQKERPCYLFAPMRPDG